MQILTAAGAGEKHAAPELFDEVMDMSPKELLYIEDALGHTQFLMTQCRTAASQLTDPALRSQAQQLVNSNRDLFTKFYNLI